MRYPSLLNNLKRVGVPVIEIDGWRTRGSSTFNPRGAVNHHTVGPRRGIAPSLGTCINGRPDVPGPLCHVLGGRDHVARLITDGRANHAGAGGTRGLSGNSSVFGLEMEHTGIAATESVLPETIEFMARVQAAFCLTGGFGSNMVVQHWEWTTRKIDFVKGTLDPNEFRAHVQRVLDRVSKPTPPPTKDWFDMATEAQLRKIVREEVAPLLRGIVQDVAESRMQHEAQVALEGSTRGYLFALMDALGHPKEKLASKAADYDRKDTFKQGPVPK